MGKHIAQIPPQHRQDPLVQQGKYGHACMKTCPSCGQRFYAADLHVTHIVSACRVIRRRARVRDP